MSDGSTVRAVDLVATVLKIPRENLEPESQISTLPGFDSLAYEQLVLLVEEETGRQLEPLEMVSVETIADLAEILKR